MDTAKPLLDLDEFHQLVAEGTIDTVICALADMHGRLMGKRMPTEVFEAKCLRGGGGVMLSTIIFASDLEMNPIDTEFANWGNVYRDFRLIPDLATLRIVPWEPNSVIVICDAAYPDSDELIEFAPRSILRTQIERAKEIDVMFKVASELEFYLAAVSPDAARASRYYDLPMTSFYRGDGQVLQASRDEWFMHQVRTLMPRFGIPVEASKPEYGLGQQEVTLDYCDTMTMADRHLLFKHGIKELAHKSDHSATFMARPFADDMGSSCHLHVSLWSASDGTALDWSDGGMSSVFGSFVAGQVANSIDIGLLYAPTINSYKRFVPDSLAGSAMVVGYDNRTCALRLVGKEESYRLEHRVPGADVNPYLAYAGLIAAGLNGIDNGMEAPSLFVGRADFDKSLPCMPATLEASVAVFAQSKVAIDALGETVHRHLVTFYSNEVRAFNTEAVTDWERIRYWERI